MAHQHHQPREDNPTRVMLKRLPSFSDAGRKVEGGRWKIKEGVRKVCGRWGNTDVGQAQRPKGMSKSHQTTKTRHVGDRSTKCTQPQRTASKGRREQNTSEVRVNHSHGHLFNRREDCLDGPSLRRHCTTFLSVKSRPLQTRVDSSFLIGTRFNFAKRGLNCPGTRGRQKVCMVA